MVSATRTERQDMNTISDWDWGTFVPPRLGVAHIFHLSDPTEARKPWLLSQAGENPESQAQINALWKNLSGRRNRYCLPLPSKYNVPSRAEQNGQCFLMILRRYLGSGKTQVLDTES